MVGRDNVARLRLALDARNSVDRRNEYFSIYFPEAVIHAHGVTSVDALRPFYDAFWAAFPDAKVILEEVVAEGEKVAYKACVRATHQGSFGGLLATRKPIVLCEIGILDFANGKIIHRWALDNAHEMQAQLQS
jgi:predicted ester cyclase